jgi:hypothetical protein
METKFILGALIFMSAFSSYPLKAAESSKEKSFTSDEVVCSGGHVSFVIQEQTWKVYEDGVLVCKEKQCFRLQRQAPRGLWTWWKERQSESQHLNESSGKSVVYSLAQARGTLPFHKGEILIWKNNTDDRSVSLELKNSSLKLAWISHGLKVHLTKDSAQWSFSGLGSQRDFRADRRAVQMNESLFDGNRDFMSKAKLQRKVAQSRPVLKCEDEEVTP